MQRGLPGGRWLSSGPLGCLPALPWSAHTGFLQSQPKANALTPGSPLTPPSPGQVPGRVAAHTHGGHFLSKRPHPELSRDLREGPRGSWALRPLKPRSRPRTWASLTACWLHPLPTSTPSAVGRRQRGARPEVTRGQPLPAGVSPEPRGLTSGSPEVAFPRTSACLTVLRGTLRVQGAGHRSPRGSR